jgi:hypothetical protein
MRFELPTDLGLAIPVLLSALSFRLFRLAWRTRRLPELLVGAFFLLVPFGISLSIRVDRFAPEHAAAARATANALFTGGGVAMLLFAWSVFRPESRGARWLAFGGSAALAAAWALGLALGAYAVDSSFLLVLPSFAPYGWVFGESLRYYRLLQRRQRLDLADPVLVNRFLLFAVWTGAIAAITLVSVSGTLFQLWRGTFHDGGALGDPVVLGFVRLLSVPIAVSLWLIFLAPARYTSWLRARALADAARCGRSPDRPARARRAPR